MPTIRVNRSWSVSGASPIVYEIDVEADGESNAGPIVVPDGAVDFNVLVAIDVSRLKALLIGSTQDVTIETNHPGGASGEPDDTIEVKANAPYLWTEDDPEPCLLTVDVEILYVTNNSGADATLNVRAPMDVTP